MKCIKCKQETTKTRRLYFGTFSFISTYYRDIPICDNCYKPDDFAGLVGVWQWWELKNCYYSVTIPV